MRNTWIFGSVILSFSLLVRCGPSQDEGQGKSTNSSPGELAAGFELLETNCFSCHSPNGSIDNRVAPPMIAIKKHYIDEETSKDQFTADLIKYVNEPTEENTRMPGAVKRFGVMPKMNFSNEQLTQIAAYIYEVELEAPDWFEKHYEEERTKYMEQQNDDISNEERGLKLAMSTKAVLGKNLLGAINANGSAAAVEFCNTRAIHLTDSMSGVLNASIKRVTDLPRNRANMANAEELSFIKELKTKLANGEELTPKVSEEGNNVVGYYPITTNAMCMQCHGAPFEQIEEETFMKLASLYPEDQAMGYGENELRGIWVVDMTMDK